MTTRHLLITAFILLVGFSTFAQSRLYLKPSAGIGFTNVRESYSEPITLKKSTPVPGYNATLGIGYKKNKIGFETGVGYLRTGKKISDMFLFTADNPAGTPLDRQIHYHHIIVPFRISYQLDVHRKFAITPAIGGAFSYNFGAANRIKGAGYNDLINVPTKLFRESVKPVGLFGEGQLNGTYKLNKNLDIFGGPSFQYMITNMSKKPENTTYDYKLHPYTWGINAGINLYLSEPAKPADTQKK